MRHLAKAVSLSMGIIVALIARPDLLFAAAVGSATVIVTSLVFRFVLIGSPRPKRIFAGALVWGGFGVAMGVALLVAAVFGSSAFMGAWAVLLLGFPLPLGLAGLGMVSSLIIDSSLTPSPKSGIAREF